MKLIEHLTIKPDRPFIITCMLVGIALLVGYTAYPYLMDSIIETTTKEYRLDEELPNSSIFIVSGNIEPYNTSTYTYLNFDAPSSQDQIERYGMINDGYGERLINFSTTNITMSNCVKVVVYKTILELRVIKVLGDCE